MTLQSLPKMWMEIILRLAHAHDLRTLSSTLLETLRDVADVDEAAFVFNDGSRRLCSDTAEIPPHIPAHESAVENIRSAFAKSLYVVPALRKEPLSALECYWKSDQSLTQEQLESVQTLADILSWSVHSIEMKSKSESTHAQFQSLKENYDELRLRLKSIAHDLRNPTTSLYLVLSRLSRCTDSALKSFESEITIAKQMTERLNLEIDKIIAFYRTSKGVPAGSSDEGGGCATSMSSQQTPQERLRPPK